MESKLARQATQQMAPEERPTALVEHRQLMMIFYDAGEWLRTEARGDPP